MSSDDVNKGRRRFLVAATSVVGGVGVGIAAVPFIKSWMPSAKAHSVGAPVEVNISKLKEGQLLKVQWRGQTIGVFRIPDCQYALYAPGLCSPNDSAGWSAAI